LVTIEGVLKRFPVLMSICSINCSDAALTDPNITWLLEPLQVL
jgi:hypothetical protein